MNGLLRCCIAAATVLGLAACASHGTMRYEPVASTAIQPTAFEQDAAYIQTVERVARRRGVSVQWINPPLRRVVASADGNGLE